ncbi:hypothetical protein FGG22_gp071 [Mycobacterium phage Hammer]|uniref:Uncharacterized protein n=1 Tax=Mycobacterium phage Hammer TaxID=2922204 RepID=G1D1P1_9CAUD|nr:hypothetical protein FGG22_gp071 [Mycobacterium phage Hammer]AEK08690.1 hypothetical protein HAMMER_45 [Mycobacterium phage Hammer]UQS94614.1 hypothetical protein SEA_RIFTER_45 [Mycobacterium Phage Rifter]
MKFGERFSMAVLFTAEFLANVGLDSAKRETKDEFYRAAERSPEVIVPFHHTLKQSCTFHHLHNMVAIQTEAVVLRAQLAIEGPR